jgi:DNA polymerase-3 subunit delta
VITLLFGADALGIRRRLQQLRAEADGGSGMLETNLTVIEGRDARPQDIIGPAMSPPFLAPFRLIVVEGFLDRFEQGSEQRQPRSLDAFNPLFAALEAGLPPTTMLVFTGEAIRRNPMHDRLKKIAGVTVEEYAALKPAELPRYIREEAAARGIRFRPGPFREAAPDDEELRKATDPAAYLTALLGSDTLAIASELDKLALFSMGDEVTLDVVHRVCAGERQSTGFAFVDAVMDGQHARALTALEHLLRDGVSSQELLVMLMNGYRQAATVIDLLDDRATPEEIGKAINRPWPGLRDRAIARARRLGHAGLRAAFEALVVADRTNKAGEVDEDLALELVVARLAALAPEAAGSRR